MARRFRGGYRLGQFAKKATKGAAKAAKKAAKGAVKKKGK